MEEKDDDLIEHNRAQQHSSRVYFWDALQTLHGSTHTVADMELLCTSIICYRGA